MKNLILFLFLVHCVAVNAQNPIVPAGVYMADGEGHQWKDGRMYVYVSRDESPNYYCSWRYDVLSSDDLKTWTIHKNAFASKGEGDKVAYNDDWLFAPDAAYKNGKYYLYYCSPRSEGVAVSDSPVGPFSQGEQIKGLTQIDPAVFVDDDGQAYYYWGQFTAKGAKLKDNMKELEPGTTVDIVNEKNEFFHEGSSMRKRNGIYYFVYAHLRKGRPTCIGYAMSKSPLGPFKYGGVIVDNAGCDPESWNNHGSIAEFNGKWYVIYHRSTHGSNTMRKACIEPITFNEDGTINEVEMTSQGAGDPLNAFEPIEAERACYLWGNTRITMQSPNNEQLSGITDKDYATYNYVNFGEGATKFDVTLTPRFAGQISICIDQCWNAPIGVLNVPASDTGKPVILSGVLQKPIKGVHSLVLRFSVDDKAVDEAFTVDKFVFSK